MNTRIRKACRCLSVFANADVCLSISAERADTFAEPLNSPPMAVASTRHASTTPHIVLKAKCTKS